VLDDFDFAHAETALFSFSNHSGHQLADFRYALGVAPTLRLNTAINEAMSL
jgi:hypothetical protein